MMSIFAEYNPDGTLQLGKASDQTDGFAYSFQTIEDSVALAERVKITRRLTWHLLITDKHWSCNKNSKIKIRIGRKFYN